jgi:hypothetical protein
MPYRNLWITGLSCLLVLLSMGLACAQTHVQGYYRKNGIYVTPHPRSVPDGNIWNNRNTRGNVNPSTGEPGPRTLPPAPPAWSPSPVVPTAPATPAWLQP